MNETAPLRSIVGRHGVFLRREAEALGYDDRTIQQLVRGRAWIRVHHGAYTFADIWARADVMERFRIHGQAVLRTHDPRAVLSHTSAVAVHGIELWDADLAATHVTRRDGSVGRNTGRVRYHRGAVAKDQVTHRDRVPITVAPRAAVEHALISSVESGLVTFDSALQRGLVTLDELTEVRSDFATWPGALHAQLALRLADGRSESVGESRARYLMWANGIPMPQLQYKVFDSAGNLAGIADFAWPDYGLLGEFDGRIKYGRLLKPGELAGDAVFREKQREDLMRELTGWPMIRLIWADLERPAATVARIRAMLRLAA